MGLQKGNAALARGHAALAHRNAALAHRNAALAHRTDSYGVSISANCGTVAFRRIVVQ